MKQKITPVLLENLGKFKAAMSNKKIKKGQKNPFGNYSYSSLEDILDVIEQPLLEANLIISCEIKDKVINGVLYVVVKTMIMAINDPDQGVLVAKFKETVIENKMMNRIQAIGSTISYLRRYEIVSLLNLASYDNDGDKNFAPGFNNQGYNQNNKSVQGNRNTINNSPAANQVSSQKTNSVNNDLLHSQHYSKSNAANQVSSQKTNSVNNDLLHSQHYSKSNAVNQVSKETNQSSLSNEKVLKVRQTLEIVKREELNVFNYLKELSPEVQLLLFEKYRFDIGKIIAAGLEYLAKNNKGEISHKKKVISDEEKSQIKQVFMKINNEQVFTYLSSFPVEVQLSLFKKHEFNVNRIIEATLEYLYRNDNKRGAIKKIFRRKIGV